MDALYALFNSKEEDLENCSRWKHMSEPGNFLLNANNVLKKDVRFHGD
jgi:hypothetical protein